MKYVLDASVALKWVIPEADSDKANGIRFDLEMGKIELFVPEIFDVEVAHALTRAERQGRLKPPEAVELWMDVQTSFLISFPAHDFLIHAIQLSSLHRVGVYDCLYVAMAEYLGIQLITADQKLIQSLGSRFPSILPLAKF